MPCELTITCKDRTKLETEELNKHIACHDCDLLIRLPEHLAEHQKVCCPRCGNEQFTVRRDPLDKTIALALSALVLLFISVSFPFMSISSSGVGNSISLMQAPIVLMEDGYSMLALIVLAGVIVLPCVYLLCLLAMLVPLYIGKVDAGSLFCAKAISSLIPWAMADVFVLGVLVALIKLIHMADIVVGPAFWSYIAFTVLFIMVTNIVSKRQLWFWVSHGK